jgi:hypothetical protein
MLWIRLGAGPGVVWDTGIRPAQRRAGQAVTRNIAIFDQMPRASADLVVDVVPEARLVVSCQTKFNPSDAEWNSWLTAASNLERADTTPIRLLVVTAGGHPTKDQLDRLKAVNRTNPRTSIVSNSIALRFLGAGLTFVNPTIRCFTPDQLERAFDHIELTPSDRKAARRCIERLQQQIVALPATG